MSYRNQRGLPPRCLLLLAAFALSVFSTCAATAQPICQAKWGQRSSLPYPVGDKKLANGVTVTFDKKVPLEAVYREGKGLRVKSQRIMTLSGAPLSAKKISRLRVHMTREATVPTRYQAGEWQSHEGGITGAMKGFDYASRMKVSIAIDLVSDMRQQQQRQDLLPYYYWIGDVIPMHEGGDHFATWTPRSWEQAKNVPHRLLGNAAFSADAHKFSKENRLPLTEKMGVIVYNFRTNQKFDLEFANLLAGFPYKDHLFDFTGKWRSAHVTVDRHLKGQCRR